MHYIRQQFSRRLATKEKRVSCFHPHEIKVRNSHEGDCTYLVESHPLGELIFRAPHFHIASALYKYINKREKRQVPSYPV